MNEWCREAFLSIQRPVPWLSFLLEVEPEARLMTRDEIISRRYEAMRMKWPALCMDLFTQEILVLARRPIFCAL